MKKQFKKTQEAFIGDITDFNINTEILLIFWGTFLKVDLFT